MNIPKHIAIIMDGNGRWAASRGLPRTVGHSAGIKRVEEIITAAAKIGVEALTFFAFSTENWSRPKQEVDLLMRHMGSFLKRRISKLHEKNMRLVWIGRPDQLPVSLRRDLIKAQELTASNSGMTVVLAFNYGARQEITDAARSLVRAAMDGVLKPEELDEKMFGSHLYTAGLPDPDLLIRTSGVSRVSNFLLWQISYAELYFPQKYWPDFGARDLNEAVSFYQKQERRFGGINAR